MVQKGKTGRDGWTKCCLGLKSAEAENDGDHKSAGSSQTCIKSAGILPTSTW